MTTVTAGLARSWSPALRGRAGRGRRSPWPSRRTPCSACASRAHSTSDLMAWRQLVLLFALQGVNRAVFENSTKHIYVGSSGDALRRGRVGVDLVPLRRRRSPTLRSSPKTRARRRDAHRLRGVDRIWVCGGRDAAEAAKVPSDDRILNIVLCFRGASQGAGDPPRVLRDRTPAPVRDARTRRRRTWRRRRVGCRDRLAGSVHARLPRLAVVVVRAPFSSWYVSQGDAAAASASASGGRQPTSSVPRAPRRARAARRRRRAPPRRGRSTAAGLSRRRPRQSSPWPTGPRPRWTAGFCPTA